MCIIPNTQGRMECFLLAWFEIIICGEKKQTEMCKATTDENE